MPVRNDVGLSRHVVVLVLQPILELICIILSQDGCINNCILFFFQIVKPRGADAYQCQRVASSLSLRALVTLGHHYQLVGSHLGFT